MLLIHGLDGFHDKPVEKPLGGNQVAPLHNLRLLQAIDCCALAYRSKQAPFLFALGVDFHCVSRIDLVCAPVFPVLLA
jgi:hypothetical protein